MSLIVHFRGERRVRFGCLIATLIFWGAVGAYPARAQETRLVNRYCGRVPIFSVRTDYPNPAALMPDSEDCNNGSDDDADGQTDFADLDCLAGFGLQDIFLKTPFDVVQPIGAFAPARYTGANRNGDPLGEILISSSGPGGRKLSYLRTGEPNRYGAVSLRALVLPGRGGDKGGPLAVRIQPADAAQFAGQSYFVNTVPGSSIAIERDLGDGNTRELARAEKWENGDAISIQDYSEADPRSNSAYLVTLTAIGDKLEASVAEVNSENVLVDRYEVLSGHQVSLSASDADLASGYIGLRSDNDLGGDAPDDVAAATFDPSVLDFRVSDPLAGPNATAPRIAFFNTFTSGVDAYDYRTVPITSTDDRPYRRTGATLADAALAAYLRQLGFQVDEYHISSWSSGLFDESFINENYDLLWIPSSGPSSDTRDRVINVTIPLVFSEHVDGSAKYAGLWAGDGSLNGNENQLSCAGTKFIAFMNGANEVPPLTTDATGVGTFSYEPATKELTFHIEFNLLSLDELFAHIHIGPPGETGPVMAPLPAGNPKDGSVTLTAELETELLAGNLYVNIQSDQHADGEIRGQLTVRTLSYTDLRVIPKDQGGDPDHPILRGLGDALGNIPVHDANQIALNVPYAFPGESAGVTGAGFKTIAQILAERGWGPGASETQFGGWPIVEGGKALATMVNPCDGEPLFKLDDAGNLASADGKGHTHIVAVEAGSKRATLAPENCPGDCTFGGRTVFYWISDPIYPYSTPQALSILRRLPLWALRYLESPNRSDVPFKRGDANGDGEFDISDPVFGLAWLFTGGPEPPCIDAADANDDEQADISDAVHSLTFLFLGGPPPSFPFQTCFGVCGLDFTPPPPAPGGTEDPKAILPCRAYSSCRG